jgi:hypothetical protein
MSDSYESRRSQLKNRKRNDDYELQIEYSKEFSMDSFARRL